MGIGCWKRMGEEKDRRGRGWRGREGPWVRKETSDPQSKKERKEALCVTLLCWRGTMLKERVCWRVPLFFDQRCSKLFKLKCFFLPKHLYNSPGGQEGIEGPTLPLTHNYCPLRLYRYRQIEKTGQ